MASGIYAIRNEVSGKMYVGSAIDIARRHAKHRYQLRTGKHPSKHLQASWDKYGEEVFEFAVLEECDSHLLIEREQHWIDELQPEYNKRKIAESNLGLPHTPEQTAAISAAVRAYSLTPEGREARSTASKVAWSRPGAREARAQQLREIWTPEKRAEQAARQAGIDNGQRAREVRWSQPGAGAAHSEKMRANWEGRKVQTEEKARELCAERGLEFVAMEGGTVTVHCPTHNHTASPKKGKFFNTGQGCRFCGFERSSQKQKARVGVTSGGNS